MGHSVRVTVKSNQRGVGGQALQQQCGVAASAIGRIDKTGQRADTVTQQGIHRFLQ